MNSLHHDFTSTHVGEVGGGDIRYLTVLQTNTGNEKSAL